MKVGTRLVAALPSQRVTAEPQSCLPACLPAYLSALWHALPNTRCGAGFLPPHCPPPSPPTHTRATHTHTHTLALTREEKMEDRESLVRAPRMRRSWPGPVVEMKEASSVAVTSPTVSIEVMMKTISRGSTRGP